MQSSPSIDYDMRCGKVSGEEGSAKVINSD